jgi:hypothetical protein
VRRPSSECPQFDADSVLSPDRRRRCRQCTAGPAVTLESGEWRQTKVQSVSSSHLHLSIFEPCGKGAVTHLGLRFAPSSSAADMGARPVTKWVFKRCRLRRGGAPHRGEGDWCTVPAAAKLHVVTGVERRTPTGEHGQWWAAAELCEVHTSKGLRRQGTQGQGPELEPRNHIRGSIRLV